jgi:hypothetical protein
MIEILSRSFDRRKLCVILRMKRGSCHLTVEDLDRNHLETIKDPVRQGGLSGSPEKIPRGLTLKALSCEPQRKR